MWPFRVYEVSFERFQGVLTLSVSFLVGFASFPTLCTSVREFDISVRFPRPSVASECNVALPAGESGVLEPF